MSVPDFWASRPLGFCGFWASREPRWSTDPALEPKACAKLGRSSAISCVHDVGASCAVDGLFGGLTFEVRRGRRRGRPARRKDDTHNLEAGWPALPLGLASTEGLGLTLTVPADRMDMERISLPREQPTTGDSPSVNVDHSAKEFDGPSARSPFRTVLKESISAQESLRSTPGFLSNARPVQSSLPVDRTVKPLRKSAVMESNSECRHDDVELNHCPGLLAEAHDPNCFFQLNSSSKCPHD